MMIGQMLRKISGKYFHIFGRIYRSFFVDLSVVADSISPYIPQGAMIIDIGGGDGEPLNFLFALRKDIHVKIIDRSLCIGDLIRKEYSTMVELFPGTTMTSIEATQKPDVILISDVVHHVPAEMQKVFFGELKKWLVAKMKCE